MTENYSILTAVHLLTQQGQETLGDNWKDFAQSLRTSLKQTGMEEDESSDELLLFSYPHPKAAFSSVFECLEYIKNGLGSDLIEEKLPVQILIHLVKDGEDFPPIRNTTSDLWNFVEPETLHVTRSLKHQWRQLMGDANAPAISFKDEGNGVFRADFEAGALAKIEKLFSHRELALTGNEPECFYCGMKTHVPSSCPSKFLTMETEALSVVGHLHFPKLNAIFQKVFTDSSRIINLLVAGIEPSEIRKNRELRVFVAYFDMLKIYQPRFLWNITFNVFSKWDRVCKKGKYKIDNQNMQLGFDCLRVGHYNQAEKYFRDEIDQQEAGKQFYAVIGLAFLALEQDRGQEMGHLLDMAFSFAKKEKEKIYISLLLSRYYDLRGDLWKAQYALKNIFLIDHFSVEALYRNVQIEVKSGFSKAAFKQLQALVGSRKELFMTALMDPQLLPIHGFVEEMLAAKIETDTQAAKEKLGQVIMDFTELELWFDEDNEQMQLFAETKLNLERKFKHNSYYDIVHVIIRGGELVSFGKAMREKGMDELSDSLDKLTLRHEVYKKFWNYYNYKFLFKAVEKTLNEFPVIHHELRALIKQNNGGAYRNALELLEKSSKRIDQLEKEYNKMLSTETLLNNAGLFGKKLFIAEMMVLTGALLLLPALASIFSGDTGNTLKDPVFLRQASIISSLVVAPIIALSMTMLDYKKEE